ncbi:MAG: EVE domain-containing protein [Mesorhizobium sp.]
MRYWVIVASADHAVRGVAAGFAQSCHGKGGPIGRMREGDGIVIYSPSTEFKGGERLQAFTALGRVRPGGSYQVEMEPGFHPFRRDVDWQGMRPVPIRPLLEELEFTKGKRNWGSAFRFGQFEISEADFKLIEKEMVRGLGSALSKRG